MADEIKKTQDVDTPDTSNEEVKEEKGVLTQEQFDNALKERLERERKKLNKEAEERIKKAQEEAERLARLSSEEKQKELEARTKEDLQEREIGIARRENRLEAVERFNEAKIPVHLVDYVVSDDLDKTLEKTEEFIKSYNESVSRTVADQLKGTPPRDIADNSKNDKIPKKVLTSF
jgi:bisphosphoglycerate-dependent phosphoglycerate mutase